MTDRIRHLHAHADALLATVATAAVEAAPDDPQVRHLHGQADGLLSLLVVRALEDLAGRAFPGSPGDGGGPVSSSAISNPTLTAGTRDLEVAHGVGRNGDETRLVQAREARDYHTVVRTLEHAVGILATTTTVLPDDPLARTGVRQQLARTLRAVVTVLDRCHARLTPRATGEPCPSVARDADGTVVASCEGSVTHHSTGRGLCEQCDGDWRPRRGLQIPAEVLEARNARRRHACVCHEDGHAHAPGGCLGHGAPGERVGRCDSCRCACGPDCCPDGCTDPHAPGRAKSERCKKRGQRADADTPATAK